MPVSLGERTTELHPYWLFGNNDDTGRNDVEPSWQELDEVPIRVVRSALNNACTSTEQRNAVLCRASVTPQLLQDSNARITLNQFAIIWRGVMKETGDELFKLDKRGMGCGSFRLMCLSALQSRTLEIAIRRLLRFWAILLNDFHCELRVEGDDAYIVISESGPARLSFTYSIILASLMGTCSWLIDRRIIPHNAKLRARADDADEFCRAVISPKVSYGHDVTQITIDARLLAIRPTRNEEQLSLFLANCPEAVLMPYKSRDSVSARIHGKLRQLPPDTWPAFEAIAKSLCMTSSTLRRRLTEECTSFQRIKDDIRRERAILHLTRSNLPIVEIAEELGFRDSSTFYRAFKKWTGVTPNLYRLPDLKRN